MSKISHGQAVVLALVLNRFVDQFDFAKLSDGQRRDAMAELSALTPLIAAPHSGLAQALAKLERRLATAPRRAQALATNGREAKRLKRILRWLVPLAMAGATAGTMGATPAFAYTVPAVGGTVFNPVTRLNETVVEVVGNYAVRTGANNIIFLPDAVGDTYTVTTTSSTGVVTSKTYKVTAVTKTTYGTGNTAVSYVTGVTVEDADKVSTTIPTVSAVTYTIPSAGGGVGTGTVTPTFPVPTGNEQFQDIRVGASGGDGRDGGGINLCVPFTDICAFVGVPPTRGGAGANGPTFTATIPADYSGGLISSTANDLAGIKVASIGGNGGTGGDSYSLGGYDGQAGGAAGVGGNVTANNYVTVSTSGDRSHGMWVFSQAGAGGQGGDGILLVNGGLGGGSASGGSATGNNYGSLTTQGDGAVGLLVQSLGGAGGSGGSSYGIVGTAGSGSIGGNGGNVTAYNAGTILTGGKLAYGVQAQSVGGNGGSSGNSGAIVAFGGTAGGAGTGGNSSISLAGTSSITTTGANAHGVFAQSIGGGGGSTGWTGGAVSFGGSAGSGGTGGTASISAAAGSRIETFGVGAYGMFAESVGGNGGTAEGTGGVFTMGGSGGSGNTGGAVSISNNGSVITHEADARGIFAQSVGGGGGNANASGGLVSLGGSGGSGATGGAVTVSLGGSSVVRTSGAGADGAFAQSIGGGGGTGATSSGLVALGGKGSVGGEGGTVSLTNAGAITTGGATSRGLFAQSVGGGGGSGGDSYGLAAIGGSGDIASKGGNVTIGNSGTISTTGNKSTAMQAQSIGGGGGDGGSSGGALLVIGGKGAGGGAGGLVTTNLSGSLQTGGNDSHGLFAQSVGGGGGNGGSASSGSLFAGLALGGDGAAGGAGGNVISTFSQRSVTVAGSSLLVDPLIITAGDRSRGVFLQSVGGGGGSGGMAVQVSAGLFGAASFAIGGSAASGSTGGLVQSRGDVSIRTTGNFSEGYFAQSVGGGGGNGGAAVSVAASVGEGVSAALSVGIGGKGGGGGAGGTVDAQSGGTITTTGQYSTGFVAQSVGGGGGKGGFSVSVAGAASDGIAITGALGIGGTGGSGGTGGTVTGIFNGDISTGGLAGLGSDSAGALIQSVGGGGGVGGFNVSATVSLAGGTALGASVGLGGAGGSGGVGGTVTGTVGGNVQTSGARSTGVLVQSVGGGGGSGGFNVTGNIGFGGAVAGGVSVGIGGTGGGAGAGGKVTGTVNGTVVTAGKQSDGVVIQSVGGGGGSGGFNVSGNMNFGGTAGVSIGVGLGGSGGGAGAGGKVTGTVNDAVYTTGEQSRGVIVQSVGGGGGAGAFNVTGGLAAGGTFGGSLGVGLGGTGGDGGGANEVIASARSVSTTGKDSAGFIAQSIGGGGGTGGFNVTGTMGFGGTAGGTIGVGLGGSGGGGGSAMKVTAGLTGAATTGNDRSGAILAQSVGGGGGSGAFNVTGGITFGGTGSGTLNIGLGGSGGTAGNGGEVKLDVVGYASTNGVQSDGIVAQSIGGGGGNGGFNISGGIAAGGTGAGQIGVGIGGRGGGGGSAELVTLNVNHGVTTSDPLRIAAVTRKDLSAGIIAQSLGGGGGNGGFNVTGGASFAGTGAGGVNVGIGGSGGTGGHAGSVVADVSGYTATSGKQSVGVLAQSIGGGGGNGGFNVAGGLTIGGTGSGMINVGIGGSGGTGSYAGDATLRINNQIANPTTTLVAAVTGGDESDGVVVQSIGGGGGNGGFNVTGSLNIGGTGTGAANIGIGGMGGSGALAGKASADITGGIATAGKSSTGLLVQSIGGGGGNGGFNVSATLSIAKNAGAIGVGVGGFGGDAGNGGEATLLLNQRTSDSANTLAAVTTAKDDSAGIIVQSLGGGGGNGGFNVTAGVSLAKGAAGNIGVGVGGFGGDGGDAGIARASIRGDLVTAGKDSSALLVQSMGGGGGNGGFNVTGGLSASKGANGNLGIGIGGFGGDGGDGKAVFATIESDIQTGGANSNGATIQSLGGGGGNGGFNVTGGVSIGLGQSANGNLGIGVGGFAGGGGGSGEVEATLTGNTQTSGVGSYGVLVQSAGGGGGNGGFNVTGNFSVTKGASGNIGIGVGGFGGDGGDGNKVTASYTGNIVTRADKSFGATFQSLGGGGGNGAFNVTAGLNIGLGSKATGNLGVGIGGFGGGGGDAKAVIGELIGNVTTSGLESHGILMQSVGGGGGNGSMNVTGGIAVSKGLTGSIGFGLGGFGGDGGNAGTVDGKAYGDVSTRGVGSYGALFQSLGGAGGNGALNVTGGITVTKGDSTSGGVSIGIGGFGGGGGDATTVTADVRGSYDTDGARSNGVVAQSVGGGGGNGGVNVSGTINVSTQGTAAGFAFGLGGFGGDGGKSGDVTLTRVGQTVTRQSSSNGVVAQSVGGGGGLGALNVSAGISATNTGDAGSVVLGIGGFGGGGGKAGNVTATIVDSVFATGSDAATSFYPDDFTFADGKVIEVGAKTHLLHGSHGILVQSQGGGGGAGGMDVAGAISFAKADKDSTASALVFGLGGFGGSGGDAGIVDATIGAVSGPRIQVQGTGDVKSAVYVGSVGGGGGDGAMNVSASITSDGSVTAGIGGAGGGGGKGADVTAKVSADLFASGYKATGLTVQSVGGGGGNGGFNFSGGFKPLEGTEPVIVFGMGGDGGVGNSSGNVVAEQDGNVIVEGYSSRGVLVQSIAGGGGDGGMDFVANVNRSNGDSKLDGFAAGIGIGGTGGKGGIAGSASLRSTGNILVNTVVTTNADGSTSLKASSQEGFSPGVTVQSIGGGGGSGGFNLVGVYTSNGNPLSVAVGGSGGVGGDAGIVSVIRGKLEDGSVSRSLINTFGAGSAGLVAQSIGGGGGSAATNLAFATGSTKANATGFGGQIVVGGDGASSGNGKAVSVEHFGTIQTDGYGSEGILAQSIGKGGGNAAVNVGFTKLGEKTASLKFWTDEGKSTKKSNITGFSIAIGGAAGDAGSADDVTVVHDGTILTHQAASSGLVAQSFAGGGGNVAMNLGLLTGTDNNLKASIGREGGKGGTAGDVDVTARGLIVTSGDHSNGIVAQSTGGAGGMSGTTSIEGQASGGSGKDRTASGFGLSVGLEGGAGGHSGTVTVANSADIQTDGESARGIIAQSIGGDGGIAGSARVLTTDQKDSIAVAIGGGGGDSAVSAKVTVGNSGLIVTKGASSDGILAQSIGGSGGVGGSASTIKKAADNLEKKTATTIGVAVGGSGGSGSIAADVAVTNDGIISTIGQKSYGIRAQSIGGGGGVGGAVYNVEQQKAQTVNTFNVLVGGGGGDGNLAGRVDVINRGLIMTTGEGASGISANSIGGGGGDAGSVSNLTVLSTQNDGDSNAIQVAIGGGGGSGSKGGTVKVVNAAVAGQANSGTIFTTGKDAHGIFAQSLGGGGGNGSSIASIAKSSGNKDSISLGINIGGAGGDGNVGGEVIVENSGSIQTEGEGSYGILAQSIGGSGGNGGLVLSTNILLKAKDKSPLISIGGIGGAGNDGGHVSVINSGRIFTKGKNADGIVAQSIGGGGGNAGMGVALTGDVKTLVASNLMALAVGALGGGSAGVGGQVDVVHSGDITVTGAGSQAIVAESINGGGGHANFDLSGIAMPSLSSALPDVAIPTPDLGELDGIPNLVKGEPTNRPVDPVIVAARVGANEATSMAAGNVNVSISGTMGAGGDFGSGTTIRSIGGGGGTVTLSGLIVKPTVPTTTAGIGAAATGTVSAQATYVVGLGAKNSSDSGGAAIVSSHNGEIVTTGKGSTGVVLQSIGGGGGQALVNLAVEDLSVIESVRLGLGAVGTSNSDGGAVSRTQAGAVFTTNQYAHGAVIQSIGGGGGTAIASVHAVPAAGAAGVRTTQGWTEAALPQASSATAPAVVSLGATGGSGNDGGAVSVSFTGGFSTEGARANGLIVQSIGGGGGEVVLDGLTARSIILGGQAGASGSGGDVTVANNGVVVTRGTGANGIVLQSIGGGGGALFGSGPQLSLTLSNANSGNAGAVRLTQTGDIAVLGGGNSYGILAQSIGGGGGLVDGLFAGTAGGVGRGGLIDLKIDGQVFTPGTGSTAVAAQSLGSLGGGNITITANGAVRGGSGTGTGAGVLLDGGKDNLLTSNQSLSAVSGLAARGTSGNDTVVNNGLAVGNFSLGGGTNALLNTFGATLVTIDSIDLRDGPGSDGTFTNAGTLLLGQSASRYPLDLAAGDRFVPLRTNDPTTDVLLGTNVISKVALDGNLLLTASSKSFWDVAFGPYASDQINVTGNAAVNGTADITLTWLQNNKPVALVTTGGTAADNGLKVKDTLAMDYRVQTTGNAINLAFTSNFGQQFLTANERALGRSLDSALNAGDSPTIGRLLALLGNLENGQESTYKAIFAELDPSMFAAPQLLQFDSARRFGAGVLGCREAVDTGKSCVWGEVDGTRYRRGTERGEYRFDQDAGARLRMGYQHGLGNGWTAGISLGFDDSGRFNYAGDRAEGSAEGFHLGVAASRRFGKNDAALASVALSGGIQTVDLTRRQSIFVSRTGVSHYKTDYLGGTARLSYTFDMGTLFARPELEASMFRLGQQRFAEQGLEGLGITGLKHHEWIGTASPLLSVGAHLSPTITLSLKGGGVFHNEGAITAPLRLVGENAGADPAMIRSLFDKSSWMGGAELRVTGSGATSLDFGYRIEAGKSVQSQEGRLTFRARF
ncbi:hypothetical protein GCM10022281_15070 [Sphingomonas rosea]|uniref:Autotransporter domain-containing protein n=1 Tax=Sphingomonas rosea TaxID=335605 RepID=A0ABP7U423_9SPHN